MCLAIPARIVSIGEHGAARGAIGGVVKDINLSLVDGVEVGDYVIVHVGFALSRLEPDEAEATLALFAEAGVLALSEEDGPVEAMADKVSDDDPLR